MKLPSKEKPVYLQTVVEQDGVVRLMPVTMKRLV
jgi:hypothetical protein